MRLFDNLFCRLFSAGKRPHAICGRGKTRLKEGVAVFDTEFHAGFVSYHISSKTAWYVYLCGYIQLEGRKEYRQNQNTAQCSKEELYITNLSGALLKQSHRKLGCRYITDNTNTVRSYKERTVFSLTARRVRLCYVFLKRGRRYAADPREQKSFAPLFQKREALIVPRKRWLGWGSLGRRRERRRSCSCKARISGRRLRRWA